MTSGRRLGTIEHSNAVSDVWGRWTYKYLDIVCLSDGKFIFFCDEITRKFQLSYFRLCFVPKQRGDVTEMWADTQSTQTTLFSLTITQGHCTALLDLAAPTPSIE
jgi:hypothetical protein